MNHSLVWSKEKCQKWLTQERLQQCIPQQEFWKRISAWHLRQYEKAGNPGKLEWADKCLEVMMEVEKEMGLDNYRNDAMAAQSIFKALRVEQPVTSIFAALKEE